MTLRRVPHSKRPLHVGPFHVTLRLRDGLPRLRNKRTQRVLEQAFRESCARFSGFRLLHFSVLSNHMHLFVEACGKDDLSQGMQGMAIRIAKRLNKLWGRKGSVFADRFYARALKTMNQVRRALVYVLQNARRHGIPLPAGIPDPYSSGPWFTEWVEHRGPFRTGMPPVAVPLWRGVSWNHGQVSLYELPKAALG